MGILEVRPEPKCRVNCQAKIGGYAFWIVDYLSPRVSLIRLVRGLPGQLYDAPAFVRGAITDGRVAFSDDLFSSSASSSRVLWVGWIADALWISRQVVVPAASVFLSRVEVIALVVALRQEMMLVSTFGEPVSRKRGI